MPSCTGSLARCTAQGYHRFRCGECGKRFNERSADVLNKAQYPSDIIALVVLWCLRYKLSLRDLAEMATGAEVWAAMWVRRSEFAA